MSWKSALGTRKAPSRLRLILIAVMAFLVGLVIVFWPSDANALPLICYDNGGTGERIPCNEVFPDDDWRSEQNYQKVRKQMWAIGIGCGGGFAAGGLPGMYYGCLGAGLAALTEPFTD